MLRVRTGFAFVSQKCLSFQLQVVRQMTVGVIGAAGGIGQPLSLLLLGNPRITELRLHDVVNVNGVAADLSHICKPVSIKSFEGPETIDEAVQDCDMIIITAGLPRKPNMTREQLFAVNANILEKIIRSIAKNAPSALVAIVSNPVNSLVPMAAQILKLHNVYKPSKLFGVTTLDCVRAQSFIGEYLCVSPLKVDIPVIGGHAGTTILPIVSQCRPPMKASKATIDNIVKRIQMGGEEIIKAKCGIGSATLSMAFAANRFAHALLKGLNGEKSPIEAAYVESSVTEAPFFATPLSFGPMGIEKNHGLPKLNDKETEALLSAVEDLKKSAESGICYALK